MTTSNILNQKVAVITGAADGIGKAIATRFASEGAKLLLADINTVAGQELAMILSNNYSVDVQFITTDVTRQEQVEAMIARCVSHFKRIDILVNNAWGGGSFKRAEAKTNEEIQYGLAMNLWAGFWAMKAAYPHMKARQWGRIINMCSINGVNAYAGTLEYNVGKEALRAMTRTLAREWAQDQICANVMCPAALTTALHDLVTQCPEILTSTQQPPMGRIGDPLEDIAGVAVFLGSDDARFVTGNTLFVDGGTHINGGGWSVDLPS